MRIRIPFLFLILAAALLLAACSGGDSEKQPEQKNLGERGAIDTATGVAAPDFNWNIITKQLVTFYYQPDDSLAFKADALATRIDEVFYTIAFAVGWDKPTPIDFYCYRDVETMQHFTGREDAFYIGNKFFYGYGPNYGPLVANYVMENLPFGKSKFSFMNEGLPLLLDFSGRNYHQAAFNFLNNGTLNPVSELTDSTLFEELSPARRSILSASFIGYLYSDFGPDTVQQIYRFETDDFAAAAKQILGKSVQELNQGWVEFLPKHTNEMEKVRELGKDTP